MQDLEYMDKLDVDSTLKLIVSKFPYKLRKRWQATAYKSFQKTKRRVKFEHLVEFMRHNPASSDTWCLETLKDPTPVKRLVSKNRTAHESTEC